MSEGKRNTPIIRIMRNLRDARGMIARISVSPAAKNLRLIPGFRMRLVQSANPATPLKRASSTGVTARHAKQASLPSTRSFSPFRKTISGLVYD
jgi:hypothetical protein